MKTKGALIWRFNQPWLWNMATTPREMPGLIG